MKKNEELLAHVKTGLHQSSNKTTLSVIDGGTHVDPVNSPDCFPVDPDILHYWSFGIQTGMKQQNGIIPIAPFGHKFYFVPEGENTRCTIEHFGSYESKVFRLELVNGKLFTAKPQSLAGVQHFTLGTDDRLGAPGDALQKFALFSIKGRYRLIMPFFGNKIAYRKPASRSDEILLSDFSSAELNRPNSIYDQPYMFIVELGLPAELAYPNDTH